ncbi:MAG: hypothetical protein K6C32_02185 [Bacilli bacterium]|nr:hypothetical protein [Bacilli bacterium]
MKPRTKNFLLSLFGGLVSNDRVIDGAKTHPWWVALIIFVIASFIPVIPITVGQANSYGSSFLSSNIYGFDQSLATACVKLNEAKKDFEVKEGAYLAYTENGTEVPVANYDDEKPVYQVINSETNQIDLEIYYSATKIDSASYKEWIGNIEKQSYKLGSSTEAPGEEESGYAPSFIALHSKGVYTRINKNNSTEAGSGTYTAFSADWKHIDVGTKLIAESLPDGAAQLNKQEYVDSVLKVWKGYYNKAYLTQKSFNTRVSTFLFWGIYAGLALLLGLLVFIMTRGKNNMFNYLKFIDCEKIVWWAILSPALLSLLLGFLLSSFAQMLFIALAGLRIMWLSMRQLRPQY